MAKKKAGHKGKKESAAQMAKAMSVMSVKVLTDLKDKKIVGKDLSPDERRVVVDALRHEYSQANIAHMLGVGDRTIARDVKAIKESAAKDFKIDSSVIVSELTRLAGLLKRKATDAGDFKFVWQVELDLIKTLQSLGYVATATAKVEHTGQVAHEHSGTIDYEAVEETEDVRELLRAARSAKAAARGRVATN